MSAQQSSSVSDDSQTAWKIIFALAHPLWERRLLTSWLPPEPCCTGPGSTVVRERQVYDVALSCSASFA